MSRLFLCLLFLAQGFQEIATSGERFWVESFGFKLRFSFGFNQRSIQYGSPPPLGGGAGGERAVRRNLQEKFRIKKKPEIRNEPKIAAQKIRRVAPSSGLRPTSPRRGEERLSVWLLWNRRISSDT